MKMEFLFAGLNLNIIIQKKKYKKKANFMDDVLKIRAILCLNVETWLLFAPHLSKFLATRLLSTLPPSVTPLKGQSHLSRKLLRWLRLQKHKGRRGFQPRRFPMRDGLLNACRSFDLFLWNLHTTQARNQGTMHPLENVSPPWKNVLDIAWKYWTQLKKLGPLGKLIAPPGVLSW